MIKFSLDTEYSRHPSMRRRGQALLLAVLVMVFISLIGATFITVVATNIGQTARNEEKDKARQAAAAGLAFANMQLTQSEWGTQWRANDASKGGVVPAASNNNFYWSPFDQAQGWNTAGFTKFPDPRSTNPNVDAPNYMVKVEQVLQGAADNFNNDKTGALRITTIGLSPDEPSTFHKSVAYKNGPAQSPLTGAMRSVSNWDFVNGVVPSAKVFSYDSATPKLTLENLEGVIPEVPFYIMVGDPTSATPVRGQVVSGKVLNGQGRWELTLAANLLPTGTDPSGGERVEIAAAIGGPRALDFKRDSVNTNIRFDVSNPAVSPAPGSVWVNGGLLWYGAVNSVNLNATTNGGVPGFIRSSGLMRRTVAAAPVTVSGATSASALSGSLVTDSKAGNFPLGAANATHDEVITDGYNRLLGSTDPTRQVKPFTPPNINSGGDGLGRYRQIAKYSPSLDAANPQGAAYGSGRDGIYINNFEDREKIYDTTTNRLHEMTRSQLRDLWFSDSTSNGFSRQATGASVSATNKSLEEQHLRGWVGNDEFLARGALVEINANNTITITRDARSDNTTTDNTRSLGPVPGKGWSNTNGELTSSTNNGVIETTDQGGEYSRTFAWPQKGVIFAEGNIRIRGEALNAPTSLSVVSMNNIYIEDSVGTGVNRKLLLMARKNVILNPTRITGRIDYQTRLSQNVAASATTLQVEDAASFRAGDWLYIDSSSSNDPPVCVQSVSGKTITLLASTPVTTAKTAGLPVKTQTDPVDESSTTPYTRYANRLFRFSQTLQRRVPNTGNNLRIALRHSAERRRTTNARGLSIEAKQTTDTLLPSLNEAKLENKLVGVQQHGIIQPSQKVLKIPYTDSVTPSGSDNFPTAVPADEAAALALRMVDADADVNNDIKGYLTRGARTSPNWHFLVTDPENYGALPSPPPFSFSAAVGNRYDADRDTDGTTLTFPHRKALYPPEDPAPYTIPVATSVQLLVNGLLPSNANYPRGIPATIGSDQWNSTLEGGTYERVKQFGFNFFFGATANTFETWEDVLTVDQSFYRSGYGAANATAVSGANLDNTFYTLDSRTLSDFTPSTTASSTLAFRFDPRAEPYFSANDNARMPYYRLSRLKMEKATLDGTTRQLNSLNPGHTFNINAFVYAQEGSWFVIPGDYFEDVRFDWVNLPGASASLTKQAGENLDLNRDGQITQTERAAVYRFSRYNYKIAFKGAIMENKSAIVQNTGVITGDVQDWTEKWVNTTLTSANFPSGILDHNTINYEDEMQTISYEFDPAAANGILEADPGWHPPISPELLYQTG